MSTTSASSHADHWDVSNSAGGGGLKRHEVVATHAGEQTICSLYLVSPVPSRRLPPVKSTDLEAMFAGFGSPQEYLDLVQPLGLVRPLARKAATPTGSSRPVVESRGAGFERDERCGETVEFDWGRRGREGEAERKGVEGPSQHPLLLLIWRSDVLLCDTLQFSFPREVEIIRSASQPPSTTHAFSFALPPAYSTVARPNSLRQADL